ncbi:hypothetical protein BCR42DRAFT_442980 [Absidia repens]|uniref:PH domain-containing protein n=1 Tax=Absidia repens TaxID=90262 RepID=A0A1X2I0R5_9FUNG|nr:hypothetical protein BCR42DRAFT_442980 [Absidia repens]
MGSIMEASDYEHHLVQRLSSSYSVHNADSTGSSVPKRFWNLQNFKVNQQRDKVGPLIVGTTSEKDRARFSMEGSLLPLKSKGVEDEDEDDDQDKKHGLRRKAAKGLKRIITHFSLADVNSFSGTPGLTSTTLSHHRHNQPPFNFDVTNSHYTDDFNERNMVSSDESSLYTLSIDMDDVEAEFENDEEEEENNVLNQHHHYGSKSHPALLMLNNIASLANRSLPPLPSNKLSTPLNVKNHALDELHYFKEIMHQAHVDQKLRQAVHWCRKPFHRFMSSPMISTLGTFTIPPCSKLMSQDNHLNHSRSSSSSTSSSSSLSSIAVNATAAVNNPSYHYPNNYQEHSVRRPMSSHENQDRQPWTPESRRKVLRCQVIQITNTASSKEYHYELYVQLNDDIQALKSGIMKKITKGISAASPKESISFEVKSPFTLTFTLCAKPVNSGFSKMKTFISKMDLARHQQTPSFSSSSSSSFRNNDSSTKFSSKMPVVGSTCLLSRERFEAFSGKGLSRYTLTKPHENENQKQLDEMNLELMVAFQLEDSVPFSHACISDFSSGDVDFEDAFAACHQGDYLTFYIRSKQFPTWNRYWVTLDHGQLYFRQFSNEHKGPVESIPLSELQSVCKPGEDIQEQVYFGRQHGIVLKFKTNHIRMDQVVLKDDENVEGYMYLFADSPQKASLWQAVFNAYALADYVIPNASINVRYLW